MPERKVSVTASCDASPAQVWSLAGDFCADWHPAIDTITARAASHGALIRSFTVHGERTHYEEQLVYRSDSDRTLMYTHLQGIEGVQHYLARLSVEAGETGGSRISWSAALAAAEPRAQQIADGTEQIFAAGIAALIERAEQLPAATGRLPATDSGHREVAAVSDRRIAGDPALAVSLTATGGSTLCLMLHGIGGARHNWLEQLALAADAPATDALANEILAGVQLAAMDLRGYGDSEAGRLQSSVDDYCADILRVVDALGADKLVLCGLSYGAWIATSFAMRYPQRLAGLMLCGGCTGMSEAAADERQAFRDSRERPLNAGKTPADFAPDVVSIIAGPDASDSVRQRLQQSMAAIPASTYRDALNCFTRPTEQFDFSRLTMPVLMITGEHDRLAPPAEIRQVAGRIVDAVKTPPADVRFEVIDGAGHLCNIEKPAPFNRLLGEFIARVTP